MTSAGNIVAGCAFGAAAFFAGVVTDRWLWKQESPQLPIYYRYVVEPGLMFSNLQMNCSPLNVKMAKEITSVCDKRRKERRVEEQKSK